MGTRHEYTRDELGRFARPGDSLTAKTIRAGMRDPRAVAEVAFINRLSVRFEYDPERVSPAGVDATMFPEALLIHRWVTPYEVQAEYFSGIDHTRHGEPRRFRFDRITGPVALSAPPRMPTHG